MNHNLIIKITNKVALWATIALFYWTLIFTVISVFNLKVFREHMTETFFMSIFGIFALLSGALILNVMSNLSKISTHISPQDEPVSSFKNIKWWLLSLPLILILLFGGNMLSTNKKENRLVDAAFSVIEQNPEYSNAFANYNFDESYVRETTRALQIINKIDKFFPHALVIQRDLIDNKPMFLKFGDLNNLDAYFDKTAKQNQALLKQDFILTTGKNERAYLTQVFDGKTDKHLFVADKNHYELFYPVVVNNKRFVMYFSDYQRYGKFGS